MLGLGRIFSSVRELYNELNPATFTGAIDVIVVEHPDGSLACTPFYVRFGKMGVLRSREKLVDVTINDEPVDLFLKLGDTGEAFFVEDTVEEREMSIELATSPYPTTSGGQLMAQGLADLHKLDDDDDARKAKSKSESPPSSSNLEMSKIPVKKLSEVIETLTRFDDERSKVPLAKKTLSMDDERGLYQQKKIRRKMSKIARRENLSSIRVRRRLRSSSWHGGALSEGVIALPGTSSNDTNACDKEDDLNALYKEEDRDVFEEPPVEKDTRKKLTKLKLKSDDDKKEPPMMVGDQGRQMSAVYATPCENIPSSPLFKDALGHDDIIFQLDFSDDDRTAAPADKPIITDSPYQYENVGGGSSGGGGAQKSQTSDYISSDCDDSVSPITSNDNSRVTTPVSDDKSSRSSDPMKKVEWALPETLDISNVETPKSDSTAAQSGRWGISNVWNLGFIRRSVATSSAGAGGHSVKAQHPSNKTEGIYLDDLLNSSNKNENNAIDPQLASMYLDSRKRNLTDNGNWQKGKTIALDITTPIAVAGSSEDDGYCSKPSSVICENHAKRISRQLTQKAQSNPLCDIEVSFCGRKKSVASKQRRHIVIITEEQFQKGKLTYEDFVKDPDLLFSKKLVIKLNENYYNYKVAVPVLISQLIFQRPICAKKLSKLCSACSNNEEADAMPIVNSAPVIIQPRISIGSDSSSSSSSRTKTGSSSSWFSWRRAASAEPVENRTVALVPESNMAQANGRNFGSTISLSPPGMDERDALSDGELEPSVEQSATTCSRYKKTLHLSSDQLKSLNLKPDVANRATFSVTTKYQGTCMCECSIYLWKWDDKIVISDVDGTITRSDVLGHLMPIVGRQWEHPNVAELFTAIVDNGYKIMYLTARAIGQSAYTKDYLRSIKQCDYSLPDGPLQMSPCSILSAFHREVIEKKPEIFKTKCLQDIKAAFPKNVNPFYAGFGNRPNDEIAYKNSGISGARIFTISWSGEVVYSDKRLRSSYQLISEIMDHIFPPLFYRNLENRRKSLFTNPESYSNYTYWRQPSAVFEIDVEKFSSTTDKKRRKSGTAGIINKK